MFLTSPDSPDIHHSNRLKQGSYLLPAYAFAADENIVGKASRSDDSQNVVAEEVYVFRHQEPIAEVL